MNVRSNLDVDGAFDVDGNANVDGTLTVGGTLTVNGKEVITEDHTHEVFDNDVTINGKLTVGGSLNVEAVNIGPYGVITCDDGLSLTYANKTFFSYNHSQNQLHLKTNVFNNDVNLLERLLALEAKVAALEQQQEVSQERVTTNRLRLNTLTGDTTYPIELTCESNKLYGTTYDYEGNELAKGQIWDGRPDWGGTSGGEIGG